MGRKRRRDRTTANRPMSRRALLSTAGMVGFGSVAAMTGTGAFSSARADRGLEVSVADDANAYIKIEAPDTSKANVGEKVDLLEITNHWKAELEIDRVEFVGEQSTLENISAENTPLSEIDDRTAICAKCAEVGNAEGELEFIVSTNNATASIVRPFSVTCHPVIDPVIDFRGNPNDQSAQVFLCADSDREIEVIVRGESDASDNSEDDEKTVNVTPSDGVNLNKEAGVNIITEIEINNEIYTESTGECKGASGNKSSNN